jgi:hypothetical protein
MFGIKMLDVRILLMSWGSSNKISDFYSEVNVFKNRHTARFKQLHDRPNSDVLECSVWAGQETIQILVHSPVRLIPNIVERRIVISRGAAVFGQWSDVNNEELSKICTFR